METPTNDNYIKFKNNPDDLFSEIDYKNEEELKQLVVKLNHNENIDICEYATKAIERGCNVFYISSFLDDIISEFKLNKESLFNYFRIVNKSMQGDYLSSKQYTQIQSITIKQPLFAEEFLDYSMLSDEYFAWQYIVEIILYLDKFDINEKHSRLLKMANSFIENQVICGIYGLGRINYPNDNHELITKTLFCLDSLVSEEQNIINGAIVNTLILLYRFGDIITLRLIDLSERKDPFVLREIAKFLFLEYEKICKESFFEKLLYSLVKTESKNLGRNNDIDMLLYSMIKNEENINLVIDFLIKWMTNSDCKPNKIESLQLLDCTFSGIFSNTSIMQKTLLSLLNNDNIYAPQLASYIVSSNSHSRYQNICFDINSLLSVNDADIIFICRKILGFFIHSETILSLFYSLLIGKRDDEKIVRFLTHCFIDYIGYNFPVTTIKFFEGIICDKELTITLKTICNNILEKTKDRLREITERQKLNELKPSRKDSYILYREEWRNNQRINKLADKKSILNIISSRSYIKYGKAASYHVNGNITEPQSLKCFSYSMELPYELLIDPVKYEENLYNFRLAERNE